MLKRLVFFACSIASVSLFAQEKFPLGVSRDDDVYNSVPLQSELLRGDFGILESKVSIKQFCPKPISQRKDLISPSMAAAYGARTIIEAKKRGISNDPLKISRELAFSPVFNYFMSKPEGTEDCLVPVSIHDVLQSMKENGTPRMNEFMTFCPQSVSKEVMDKATSHRITDYLRLFDVDDDADEKVDRTKYSVSQELPVIITMHTPHSFFRAKDFWQPREEFDEKEELHSMVVVGYDDNKYGGAFEVMNSWGSGWGNDGFIWIKYSDFAQFVRYGYELFLINGQNPDEIDMIGNISVPTFFPNEKGIVKSTGNVQAMLIEPGYYKAKEAYPYNTHVKVKISSLEKSFIYVFSSDLSEEFFPLFPDPNSEVAVSPAMPFKKNIVELPLKEDEYYYLEDENEAKNFLCVVFAKEELWMKSIEQKFSTLKGMSFEDKIREIFKGHLVEPENVVYEFETIKFSGRSRGKTILPIILEVDQERRLDRGN